MAHVQTSRAALGVDGGRASVGARSAVTTRPNTARMEPGRPRRYCSNRCRQKANRQRRALDCPSEASVMEVR